MIMSMEQRQFVGIGFCGLIIWRWHPSIHTSGGLLHIVEVIDIIISVIGLLYFWDDIRGEVRTP